MASWIVFATSTNSIPHITDRIWLLHYVASWIGFATSTSISNLTDRIGLLHYMASWIVFTTIISTSSIASSFTHMRQNMITALYG